MPHLPILFSPWNKGKWRDIAKASTVSPASGPTGFPQGPSMFSFKLARTRIAIFRKSRLFRTSQSLVKILRQLNFFMHGRGLDDPSSSRPGLPSARVQVLRDAFDATMRDPEFIAEARLR
jgi:hypothetical protein